VAGLPCIGRGTHRRRLAARALLPASLLALAIPIATAGVAAAATLGDTPLQTASVNGRVTQVAYSGNTLYLVGQFTQATDSGHAVTRNHAAAIDITTGHLLPWNPNANDEVDGIAVDATAGVVYLGGAFTTVGGVKETKLAQVSASTGAVSTTWKHPVTGVVNALSLGNGVLYVGGRITKVDAAVRANAAAIDLGTNTLDPAWQPNVSGGPLFSVTAVSGRVYLGGNALSIDGSTTLAKLAAVDTATGALDPTFNVHVPWEVFNIDVTPTTVYAAVGGPGGRVFSMGLDGTINWFVTVDGNVQAVTDIGGLIVAGGHFDFFCSSPVLGPKGVCVGTDWQRKKLVAVDTNGVLQDWAPQGNSALGVYAARTDAAGDQIAVGGDFTTFHFNAIQQPHLALFPFS
jgi:hypothetical protein